MVARSVRPGDPGSIDAEHDRQAVQSDVVHDLVPRTVEERRVDRHDRTHSTHRHPGGGRDRVLLGDADVEEAIGEAVLEGQQTRRAGHRRRDRHDPVVGLGQLDDGLGERLRVARRHSLGRTDRRIEHGGIVQVLLVVVLGRWIAAALLRQHVDDDRSLGGQLDGVAQRRFEGAEVVAVDRADVADPQRFEERRRLQQLASGGLDRLDGPLGRVADERNVAHQLLELALATHVHRIQADVGEEL